MPESGLLSQEPAVTWGLAWGIAAGVSEGSGDVFNRHLQEAFWNHSTSLHPPLMPALHFGGAPPLGRCSADLQVLVSRDIVLELVGFEEIFQLLHIELVKPVHLLLGGMWCLLHLDGIPHCKTKRCMVAQSQNH